jgi:hypothetical protein
MRKKKFKTTQNLATKMLFRLGSFNYYELYQKLRISAKICIDGKSHKEK